MIALTEQQKVQDREAFAQLIWTGGIMSFFILQAIIWSIALFFTHNDPSHAIIPEYDTKAIHWDEQRAAKMASDRLDWKCHVTVDPKAGMAINRQIKLTLLDNAEQPIEKAEINLRCFHKARAALAQELRLEEVAPGHYQADCEFDRQGQWRFEIYADRGVEKFQTVQTLQLGDPLMERLRKRTQRP